jgi:hypothetical protein
MASQIERRAPRQTRAVCERWMMTSYAANVAKQIDQYRFVDTIHNLPPIFHYWSQRHIAPRWRSVLGMSGVVDFYSLTFRDSLKRSGDCRRLLSIGAGDASLEVKIAERLLSLGEADFTIECLELSPILLEKAGRNVDKAGLADRFVLTECDINFWQPDRPYCAIMASHSLHHIVNLERVFGNIASNLPREGVFVTCDMIGRNGHMRWPETLSIIEDIWPDMPDRFKVNHQLRRFEARYENWDCSTQGFEGIRSQDILKLCQQFFEFDRFLAYGGVIDIFVDRSFGPNFDPSAAYDRRFIDHIQSINDKLTDAGAIKPTMMCAIMITERRQAPRVWRSWTPDFCWRDPRLRLPFPSRVDWRPLPAPDPAQIDGPTAAEHYQLGDELGFGVAGNADRFKRSGWARAEVSHNWTIGREATLFLPIDAVPDGALQLTAAARGFVSQSQPVQVVSVYVNGQFVAEWTFELGRPMAPTSSAIIQPHCLTDPTGLAIAFRVRWPRQVGNDESADRRELGLCVSSIRVETI